MSIWFMPGFLGTATEFGTVQTVTVTSTDHGNLGGLADDDHTQYALIASPETITGAWIFNANVGAAAGVTFDSVDISGHAARHQNGGADEVATATPGANAIPKAGAGGTLAAAWIAEVLALADLSDVTAKTGTGTIVVMDGSPAIVTPTIASFVNAGHNHQAAAGGGQVDHGLAMTGLADDDHTQYVHNSSARTVTAQHTFDNDPSAPFIVTAGSAKVSNLDADLFEGSHGLSTRHLFIFAQDFTLRSGAPLLAREGSNWRYAAWEFDQTSEESLITQLTIPDDYASGALVAKLYWTNLGAGAGDVRWQLIAKVVADGGDLNSTAGQSVGSDTITAPAQDILKISTSAISITPTAGALLWLIAVRDATNVADTLANDAGLLGVEIEYTPKF